MTELTTRQKEIVEAAAKLIAEGGIQYLTIGNIARRIGVTEPAIYRHFPSKMDILLAMFGQFKRRSESQLTHARSIETAGIAELETVFLEHAGQFAQHPHMAAVVFAEEAFRNEPELAEAIFAVMNLAYEAVAEVVGRVQTSGDIRQDVSKEHLALVILGTLRLLVKRWDMSHQSYDLQQESVAVWGALKTLLSC